MSMIPAPPNRTPHINMLRRVPAPPFTLQTARSAVSEEEDEDDDKGGAVETFSELMRELTAPIQVGGMFGERQRAYL